MKRVALWLELDHAFLYDFKGDTFEKLKIKNHDPHHHGHHAKDSHSHLDGFFKEINQFLNSCEIVVMGHGNTKEFFKKYTDKHYPENAKHIVANLVGDQMTDNQIHAMAKKAFSDFDMEQALKAKH